MTIISKPERPGLTRRTALRAAAASALLQSGVRPAQAAPTSLRIARQFGVGYAQMTLMEDQKLIERHAADAGLGRSR